MRSIKKNIVSFIVLVMLSFVFAITGQSQEDTSLIKTDLKAIENPEQLEFISSPVHISEINLDVQASENERTIPVQITDTPQVISVENSVGLGVNIIPPRRKESKFELQKAKPDPNADKSIQLSANDDICNALVRPLDGSCYTQADGNSNASADYYGGCVQNNHKSVWFTFEITPGNDYLSAAITAAGGKEIEMMLLTATCPGLGDETLIQSQCELSPFTFQFYNLTPGWYYLMFSTQPGSNELATFDICLTQSPEPVLKTGPEQDCFGALPVCDLTYSQTESYDNYWTTQELVWGTTCLVGGEHNSVWYTFTPQTSGALNFFIDPVDNNDDYDWALYDLDDIGGCAAIPSSAPVLCNYSATPGTTGAPVAQGVGVEGRSNGAGASNVMPGITVVAGVTYALLIDNFTGSPSGYTLDFAGAAASIADNPPATGAYPAMVSATASCTANTITIPMSEYITCISIVSGDFYLENTTTTTDFSGAIVSVLGTDCSDNELTNEIVITHNGTLTTGQYEITINAGPTLTDKCGNLIPVGSNVTFDYLSDLTLTPSVASICGGGTVNVNANGADGTPSVLTYTLNPGGLTNTSDGVFNGLTPTISTTYTVSGTYGGCSKTANTTITVEGNIISTITPGYKTLCGGGNVDLTASTLINGTSCVGCTYVWTPASTDNAIWNDATAGTYTLTVTTPGGCNNANSPSSTVVNVSAGTGGGSCDVLYVTPAGGGDGYSKTAPTTLSDAISKAQCTNTIIKMQIGEYTFTTYMPIYDYVTIEGGYYSSFTMKTSVMTGGANSTTIYRTAANDGGGDTDKCSAFVAGDNVTNFRIQDIRIEMPGTATSAYSHTAGTGVANYGIRLGSTCSDYTIVRCYIDAGVGSAPPP